jgi:hypothetical protein
VLRAAKSTLPDDNRTPAARTFLLAARIWIKATTYLDQGYEVKAKSQQRIADFY